jgi:hypothetical protein
MVVAMAGQSQILRRLSQAESIERVGRLTAEEPGMLRTQLADRVCDEFDFLDPRGRRQRSGCLKALRVLEGKGCLELPAARNKPGRSQPRCVEAGVAPPHGVPDRVDKIRGLELVLVRDEQHMRIWNSLFVDEHPLGAGPLVGRQLRYLIGSEHGWLGGLGFAAAALHLEARDRWIGWDLETRRARLDRVVGMSRFLIRPSVRCKNLASRVLGLAMGRFEQDFEAAYGYHPWLVETFVDTEQFRGTCYQAANWIRVGSTQGRGRQDRENERRHSAKDIYVYVLAEDFRTRLGLLAHSGRGPLPFDAGLEAHTWAEQEFGGAPLGDERLSLRLVHSATVQASSPMQSFPAAAEGDKALVKGHYRLLDKPDDSAVTMGNILLPHREQTIRRMQAESMVLCIHDGTDLDYNGAAQCEGLGVIGTNQTGAKSRGLKLHSTLAVNEEGLPLGVLGTRCSAPIPRPKPDEQSLTKSSASIENKKTYDWVEAMRDCEAVAAQMPHTKLVQVMDREADFFELFDEWRNGPGRTHLLVRAKHNRRTTAGTKLFDAVRDSEPRARLQLHVERQSARPKRSKQKARPGRAERIADMTLHYEPIELRVPDHLGDKAPIPLWIVHIVEEQPPTGVKAIEWFLLTTMEVTTTRQAEAMLGRYRLRWRIEDWHRVLKSGCKIEELRNETADRIKRALAIYMVIAWRVMLMTLLGREVPDLPPEVLFTDIELQVLKAYANTRRDLKPPQRLADAVRLVARLGGYLDRKRDPPPGHQVIWQGYTQLYWMSRGFLLSRQSGGDDPE